MWNNYNLSNEYVYDMGGGLMYLPNYNCSYTTSTHKMAADAREREIWDEMKRIDVMEYLRVLRLEMISDYLNTTIETMRKEIESILHLAFYNATGTRWQELSSSILKHIEMPTHTDYKFNDHLSVMTKNLNMLGFKYDCPRDGILLDLMKTYPPGRALLRTTILAFPHVKLQDESLLDELVDAIIVYYKNRSFGPKTNKQQRIRESYNRAFTKAWRPKLMVPR
jgi:hypothetical protein